MHNVGLGGVGNIDMCTAHCALIDIITNRYVHNVHSVEEIGE